MSVECLLAVLSVGVHSECLLIARNKQKRESSLKTPILRPKGAKIFRVFCSGAAETLFRPMPETRLKPLNRP